MKYNKVKKKWENVGSPIIAENVVIADGAKILGPIIIGANTVVGTCAVITKSIPANSVAYGMNRYKPKDPNYDYVYHADMISGEEIMRIDAIRVAEFDAAQQNIRRQSSSRSRAE